MIGGMMICSFLYTNVFLDWNPDSADLVKSAEKQQSFMMKLFCPDQYQGLDLCEWIAFGFGSQGNKFSAMIRL